MMSLPKRASKPVHRLLNPLTSNEAEQKLDLIIGEVIEVAEVEDENFTTSSSPSPSPSPPSVHGEVLVELILERKVDETCKKSLYLIKYVGFSEEHNEWREGNDVGLEPIFLFEKQIGERFPSTSSPEFQFMRTSMINTIRCHVQDKLVSSYNRKYGSRGIPPIHCSFTLPIQVDLFQSIFLPALQEFQRVKRKEVHNTVVTGERVHFKTTVAELSKVLPFGWNFHSHLRNRNVVSSFDPICITFFTRFVKQFDHTNCEGCQPSNGIYDHWSSKTLVTTCQTLMRVNFTQYYTGYGKSFNIKAYNIARVKGGYQEMEEEEEEEEDERDRILPLTALHNTNY